MGRTLWIAILALLLPLRDARAGTGRYVDGSPDEIELKVHFEYDEQDPTAWEPLFKEASKLLYNATEKQVRLGKVIVYNNCPSATSQADVRIYTDHAVANAHPGGLGKRGWRIRLSQTHKTVTTAGTGDRGQLGLVHELGHYGFGILDEYLNKQGQRTSDAFCIDQHGTTASVMAAGTTVNPRNQRHEFCWSGDHRTGHTRQDHGRPVGSSSSAPVLEDTDSWTWLAAFVAENYGATLTVPTATPVDDIAGHGADPVIEYHDCGLRAVTCIDRSGSMAGLTSLRAADGAGPFEGTDLWRAIPEGLAPIDLAKQGASNFIQLLGESDEAAVTSFSSDATVDFALAPMNTANQAAALAAIGGIQAGGSTNIGGGLQASLDEITGAGARTSVETIILLSDGQHNTGTSPDAVLPSIRQRGVTVHTIGLGGVDEGLMSRIASETGGTYLFARSASDLNAHFLNLLREARSEGSVGNESAELQPGEQRTAEQRIDAFATQQPARFLLVWDQPSVELGFELRRPDGTAVAPGDPGVQFFYDAARAFKGFFIEQPAEGRWTTSFRNSSTVTVKASLQTQTADSSARLDAAAARNLTTFPEPITLQASILAGASAVTGATLQGRVLRPAGPAIPLRLYDDGQPFHGDSVAGDGLYGARFRAFAGDGSYTFELAADTQDALTVVEGEDGPPEAPQPVPRFVRHAVFSTVVDGIDGTDDDLDGLSDTEETGAPGGGDGNADGTPDADQGAVASVQLPTSRRYATLAAEGNGCNQLSGVFASAPIDPPATVDASLDALGFVLECVEGQVTLLLPDVAGIANLRVQRRGPTPDDPTEHWYDFSFDGQTGAEVTGNRIVLHLKDGLRGDDDLAANEVVVVGQLAFGFGSNPSVVGIPTLSSLSLAALATLLALAGLVLHRRRSLRSSHAGTPRT